MCCRTNAARLAKIETKCYVETVDAVSGLDFKCLIVIGLMSKFILLAVSAVFFGFTHTNLFAEDAVIETLGAARAKYSDASEKARGKLNQSLERAARIAQRDGDLKLLEKIGQEQTALTASWQLPKSVNTKRFIMQMATAQSRMQKAYTDAVAELTKVGKLDRAKEIQAELDEFLTRTLGPTDDAVSFQGKEYKVFDQNLTWDAARVECERRGGRLVEISSLEENQFILNLAQRAKLESVWLGATDQDKEGGWEWLSGQPMNFIKWGPGQPNNRRNAEHYLLMITHLNNRPEQIGVWADQPMTPTQHTPGFACVWE